MLNDTEKANEYSDTTQSISRAELWVATMAGNPDGDVIRAHSEPIHYEVYDGNKLEKFNTSQLLDSNSRCELEELIYSPSATRSSIDGQRNRKEAHKESLFLNQISLRTNFEKDRDRILHSQAFRRLAGKTQVFLKPDDHQRTRLTHALEVAQIAKAIAKALRLNDTLAEAIALGHDCGHGPGGHASEDAFDQFLPGGFNHAVFGADVTLRRLNLCEETLDGIRNHSWSLNTPMTPEAEVVSFADRIAYVCHDLEDALSCEMISSRDFPKELREFMSQSKGAQIDFFIRGVVAGTLSSETIAIEKHSGEILMKLRKFNNEYIYQHELSKKQNEVVIKTLRELVEFYIINPQEIPEKFRSNAIKDSDPIVFAAVEYVAGMTDEYAFSKHALLGV